jgi:hypothetical protein
VQKLTQPSRLTTAGRGFVCGPPMCCMSSPAL